MAENIIFTRQSDGTWQGSFTSTGTKTVLQVVREENAPLFLKISADDGQNNVTYKQPKDYKDQILSINIAEGALVTVVSHSAVTKASYIASAIDYYTKEEIDDIVADSDKFKGWFGSSSALSAAYPSPKVGDYAYIKGAIASDPAAIYECATAGTWSDSDRTVDTSSVQTFADGQEVNDVHIVDDLNTGGSENVLSAKQGKVLGKEIYGQPSPWSGFEHKNLYIGSQGTWKSSANYELVIIPVHIDDVIDITWKGVTSSLQGRRVIVEDYPVVSTTVHSTLESQFASTQNEQLTSTVDGFLCLWVINNKNDITPTALSINGVDQFSGVKGILDAIEEINNGLEETNRELEETNVEITEISDRLPYNEETIPTEIIDVSVPFVADGTTKNLYNSTLPTPIPEGNKCNIEISGDTGVIRTLADGKSFSLKVNNGDTQTIYSLKYTFTADSEITSLRIYLNSGQYYDESEGTLTVKINNIEVDVTPVSVNDYVNNATAKSGLQSHQDMYELESDWWLQEKWLEDNYGSDENEVVTAFLNKVEERAGEGKYQIAVISDTHGSGAYTWRNINEVNRHQSTCYRSIAVYNKLRTICDAALHGGDLSCDYGTSRLRVLQYMYAIARKIKAATGQSTAQTKPLFITKGNHDENNNGYIEVADRINLDWMNNTYYVRGFSTFTQVTESTWDGSPLYVASTELVSDKEFRNVVQHWMSPSGAVWGAGAYYYYDIDDYKIRFIVANSFPVNDNHVVAEDEEYLWFAQAALNLSSKSNPQEWQVVVLRHTEATSLQALSSCINAFQNGTSWTYGETTVDFGVVNGGGCTFIGHVHGHEHMNCVGNAKGFFDIGENIGCTTLNYLGDATKYGLSALTIDTINKVITEDAIDGSTWVYDYANNKILMNVGDTVKAAKSGLSDPTPTSSDTTVATCDGMIITAVGLGDADITLSSSIIYHVRVQ